MVVALTNAISDDPELDDASAAVEDASVNVSMGSNEHFYSPIGIFTKYPDDASDMFAQPETYELPDKARVRRKINEMHSLRVRSPETLVMGEENKEEQTKVPLQGIIAAIETDLVTTALLASTQLHKRQSVEHENNASAKNDSFDANKNLFADLFNFTRPEQAEQTDGKENEMKIPLNGLVGAVEATLINSAQNLKDTEQIQSHNDDKYEINSNSKSIGLHRIDRDTGDKIVQVQTLDGNEPLQSLNILSSIALKPVCNETELTNDAGGVDGDDNNDTISSMEYPENQRTNFTVIQASNRVSLVPDGDDKLAHVQHQAISKAVFQSNLAIFPTIAPNSLSTITSAQQISKEDTNPASPIVEHISSPSNSTTNKSERNLSVLREKIAEIQAPPVILSSFP